MFCKPILEFSYDSFSVSAAAQLADVLQEVRDEVQREHERKLEQLKDEHRRETNRIREKYLDEVRLELFQTGAVSKPSLSHFTDEGLCAGLRRTLCGTPYSLHCRRTGSVSRPPTPSSWRSSASSSIRRCRRFS